MSHKFDELQFIPITDPNIFGIIPNIRYLFEQVRDRDWEVDDFYKWAPLVITSPLSRLWFLTDVANVIKGILWIVIDPFSNIITVSLLSVDKEYQMNGDGLRKSESEILTKIKEHLHKFRAELKEQGGADLKEKILWTTTRPRIFEKMGAKRNKQIIMEL